MRAADRSPFWAERLAGRDLASFTESDLPSLPVLTRAEMMAEFDRVVTVPGLTLARVRQHLDQSDDERGYMDGEYQAIITSGYIGTQAVHVYGWDAFVTFVMQGSRWTGRRGEDPDAVLAQAFATSTRHESGIFHDFSTFESGGPAIALLRRRATPGRDSRRTQQRPSRRCRLSKRGRASCGSWRWSRSQDDSPSSQPGSASRVRSAPRPCGKEFGPRGGSRLPSSGAAQRGPMPFHAASERACTSPTIW